MQQVVAQVARASEHARPQGQAVFLETGHPPCLQRAVGEHGDLRGSQRQHDVQAARGDGHGNRRAGAVLCLGVYPDPVQPASLADEFLVDGPRHPHSPVPVGIQAGGGVLGRVDQHRPLRGQGELRVTQLAAHRFGQSAQPSRAAVHRRECGFEQVIAVIKPAQAMGTAHPAQARVQTVLLHGLSALTAQVAQRFEMARHRMAGPGRTTGHHHFQLEAQRMADTLRSVQGEPRWPDGSRPACRRVCHAGMEPKSRKRHTVHIPCSRSVERDTPKDSRQRPTA